MDIAQIDEIRNELDSVDSNWVSFFKTTEVPFSKGTKVNLEVESEDFKNLAKRIYYTRNSIAHRVDKEIYVPLEDDKYLINEIYLMQIIAEKITVKNAKEV